MKEKTFSEELAYLEVAKVCNVSLENLYQCLHTVLKAYPDGIRFFYNILGMPKSGLCHFPHVIYLELERDEELCIKLVPYLPRNLYDMELPKKFSDFLKSSKGGAVEDFIHLHKMNMKQFMHMMILQFGLDSKKVGLFFTTNGNVVEGIRKMFCFPDNFYKLLALNKTLTEEMEREGFPTLANKKALKSEINPIKLLSLKEIANLLIIEKAYANICDQYDDLSLNSFYSCIVAKLIQNPKDIQYFYRKKKLRPGMPPFPANLYNKIKKDHKLYSDLQSYGMPDFDLDKSPGDKNSEDIKHINKGFTNRMKEYHLSESINMPDLGLSLENNTLQDLNLTTNRADIFINLHEKFKSKEDVELYRPKKVCLNNIFQANENKLTPLHFLQKNTSSEPAQSHSNFFDSKLKPEIHSQNPISIPKFNPNYNMNTDVSHYANLNSQEIFIPPFPKESVSIPQLNTNLYFFKKDISLSPKKYSETKSLTYS